MENLILIQSEETPDVNFNANGILRLSGISIPENVVNFYTPLLNWITEFEKNLPNEVHLIFEIEYINTSSTRALINLIKKVLALDSENCKVKIIWRYDEEDEDNFDLGRDLEYSAKTKFEFITK